MPDAVTMDTIVSLCRRRGFGFPSSEIYGGLGSSYDYGHYGVLLKDNVKQRWLSAMVQERDDIVALDSSIILHPQVWEASDGAQGIAMMNEHDPELVMLDINLPIMNGVEVLRAIQEVRPEVPVIMMSSQSSMKTVLECVKLGAVAYILKHSPPAEALKMLREAVASLEDDAADETA